MSGNDFDKVSMISIPCLRKYLRAEGLMLNSKYKVILLKLTNKINAA